MRLAISLIGWGPDQDADAPARLAAAGVEGIEVAPTRLWGSWPAATPDAARRYRDDLEALGLACPAMQSLFFGVDGAMLTGDAVGRRIAGDHLARVAELAGALGARVAVLGSPGNRRRGELSHAEASRRMREALVPAAEAFAGHGAAIGIEHNPPEYNCDFLTTYEEVRAFVADADHPGIAAHLDAGGLRLVHEEPDLDGPPPAHFHLSAPGLEPFDGEPREWHVALGRRLAAAGYTGWASIEQRASADGLATAERAVVAARAVLGAAGD